MLDISLEEELLGKKSKKRKKGINSDAKGKKNERALVVALTKWVGTPFTRVPSSGGLRWKNNPSVIGDVIPQDISFSFPFTIETKHYKKLCLQATLRSNSQIYKFFEQATRDAIRAEKKPLLILRHNGMSAGEWWVFMGMPTYLKLRDCKELGLSAFACSYTGRYLSKVTGSKITIKGFSSDIIFSLPYEKIKDIFDN